MLLRGLVPRLDARILLLCHQYSDSEFVASTMTIRASLQQRPMFFTFPHYEFRMPTGLVAPDARHWRVMELSLHLPWFIVSVLKRDPVADTTFVSAYFFAWENDFTSFLPTLSAKEVIGVACMAPGWKSANANWTSHEVREVWSARSEDGSTYLELVGADGEVLDVGLASDPLPGEQSRTQLLKIRPRRRPRLAPKSRGKTVSA